MKSYWVYILCSRKNGTLYVGVTNDLVRRVYEHRCCMMEGFTQEHKISRLVYCAEFSDIVVALAHEKRLKKWRRAWKVALIESVNPSWRDLYDDLQ